MSPPTVNEPLATTETLEPGRRVVLDARHAEGLAFRGINPKEAFTLVDAEGHFFRASLASLTKRGGEALVYERMAHSPESPLRITLLCAVLARQRMLGVVQKATELGVMRVVPVISAKSVQREGLAHEKAHAWPGQALRAARQCRRASVPEVRQAVPLEAALEAPSFRGADLRFFLDLDGQSGRDELTPTKKSGVDARPGELAFVVGPEGGWSPAEQALLRARGATPLRFGGRVLRAETAALVGVALLQHLYGDL